MKRVMLAVVALWMASADSAEAAKVGEKLYIKAKNTKLLSQPRSTARVVAVAQPGEQVTWNGAVKRRSPWHKVTFKGKRGIVYKTTLSTKPPSFEMSASGQKVNAMAFASSGAATKALGAGAKAYGDKNNLQSAVQSIERLEELAKSVSTKQIEEHVRANKLAPNVGAGR